MAVRLHTFNYTDFTNKEVLGDGEFGRVYAAKHPQFNKLALRIISRRYYAADSDRNALRKEAEELFLIVSEQVIRLFGVVMEPDHLCLVFEYAEYGSLDKVLLRHKMPWPLKIRIAYEIGLGMCFLHEKSILHMRLKCRNVLITGNVHAKISDICFRGNREMNTWTRYARVYSQTHGLQVPPRNSGNAIAHVPPELIRDVNAEPDQATDVYAYAIIMWQILTNETPYDGADPGEICRKVVAGTRPLDTVIPPDRPDIMYDLMLRSWDHMKQQRPPFNRIVHDLKPVFENIENEAREFALVCQKDLSEFCFRQGQTLGAPVGDMRSLPQPSTRPQELQAGADGMAVPISERDVRVVTVEPPPKNSALPIPPDDCVIEPCVTPDNKDEPVQIPGENSPRDTLPKDLYKVAEELGTRWRWFGRCIGFSDGQLDTIELNYKTNGFPEIPYQMLRQWKEKSGPVTVAYLIKILKENDLAHIARCLDP